MEAAANALISALKTIRVPATPGEYDIHALAAKALTDANIPFTHEEPLMPGRRVDFLAGDIAVEIKKGKPVRARLMEQAAKYLASPRVSALIVVSQRSVSLPRIISGKPVYLITLDKLWGVSLP